MRVDSAIMEGPLETFKFTIKNSEGKLNADNNVICEIESKGMTCMLVIPPNEYTISNPTALYSMLTNQFDKLK